MTVHKDIGAPYNVRGFPTLKFFGADKSNPHTYNGKRDVDTLVKYAQDTAQQDKTKLESGEVKPRNLAEEEEDEVVIPAVPSYNKEEKNKKLPRGMQNMPKEYR